MTEWIDVKERLPGPEKNPERDGHSCWGIYIVAVTAPNISDKPIVIPANWTGEWRNDGGFPLNVTHWQPLPEPPHPGAPQGNREGQMSDAESKVRAAWEKVDARPTHTGRGFVVRLPVIWNQALTDGYFKSEEGAWSAALAFTEQRLREIAEVEEEITLLERWRTISGATKRILAREQAHLAELKWGMKAEATQ